MNEWNTNSPETHPPCQVPCIIRTKDGVFEAVWVERINKYVSCNRWRRTAGGLTKKERWIDDNAVLEWSEI